MKNIFVLLLALVCARPTFAFDVIRARGILDTLASDQYAGRRPGTEGGQMTEYFLATKLSAYRIFHGGNGSYFQDVPGLITEEQDASLTLLDHELGRIPFTLGVDFALLTHSGSATRTLPVVIAGFGYVRPDKQRDDYDSVDVKGKAVVIIRDLPASPYDFVEDYSRRSTLAWAKQRGAAAVLYYQSGSLVNGAAIFADLYDPDLPLLYVNDRMLEALLDDTGYSLATYVEKVKVAPFPLETGKRVQISTKLRQRKDIVPRNVLGFIYGTDPVLRKEIIVVGGHHDHIGRNARGVVYNGANDNGSGSAVASELARALAANPPRRSVLIIHFTGEEGGLLGSDYFVKHPTIPLPNVVGMVNLDCEGMGAGLVAMNGGETWGPLWRDYVAGLDSSARSRLVFSREDGHGASDYFGFQTAGIPTMAFWSRGEFPILPRLRRRRPLGFRFGAGGGGKSHRGFHSLRCQSRRQPGVTRRLGARAGPPGDDDQFHWLQGGSRRTLWWIRRPSPPPGCRLKTRQTLPTPSSARQSCTRRAR